jgi:hypothetical protein
LKKNLLLWERCFPVEISLKNVFVDNLYFYLDKELPDSGHHILFKIDPLDGEILWEKSLLFETTVRLNKISVMESDTEIRYFTPQKWIFVNKESGKLKSMKLSIQGGTGAPLNIRYPNKNLNYVWGEAPMLFYFSNYSIPNVHSIVSYFWVNAQGRVVDLLGKMAADFYDSSSLVVYSSINNALTLYDLEERRVVGDDFALPFKGNLRAMKVLGDHVYFYLYDMQRRQNRVCRYSVEKQIFEEISLSSDRISRIFCGDNFIQIMGMTGKSKVYYYRLD